MASERDEIKDILESARKKAIVAVCEALKRAGELLAEGGRHDLMSPTALAAENASKEIREYLTLRRRVSEELAKYERPVTPAVPFKAQRSQE